MYWPNANGTTPNPHNLNFSADNLSGEVGGGTAFLTNVVYKLNGAVVTKTVYNGADFNSATQRSVEITVANNFPTTLYYWCYNHLNMGSSISFVNPRLSSLSDVLIAGPTTGQVLKYNGTAWINDADSVSGGAGVGTVTTVSVTSANGFTGTVATASSTPAITITTSITGVLKGNGTAISAATSGTDYAPGTGALATGIVKSTTTTGALSIAVAGTDYQAPIGTITGLVKGNGANALTAAVAGTDYQSPLPAQTGQTGKYLTTDGTTLSWATVTGGGSGTVTSTSVVSANGFAGTVATSTSTPAITITTSITGVLKGNGTAISAAVAGTDYQAPIGTISGIVKGNGANALTAAVAGTDYQSAQSVNGIVKSSGTTRSAAVAGTDYIAPYSSQAANTFLAAPSVSAGTPLFRGLTSADIPSTIGAIAHSGSVTLNGSANLIFTGSTSGTVTFVAGISPATQSYTLPSAYPGVAGYVLSSTTLGVLSWVDKASGTVTSVSVASANGFAGTVATSTSTPAITITTSITGVLKGNGTAISAAVAGTDYQSAQSVNGIVKSSGTTRSAAVAGTDYQAPIGTISGLVKGNGANALTAATAGTDYQAPVSATGLLKSSGVSGNVSAASAGTDYQAPITLTTTGSSGAATFSGNTLNIPQYTAGAGTTAFSGLTDVFSAGLTVDEIYLPAITRLVVTTPVFNYNIDQYSGDNPAIYVISGTTIAFNLQVGGSHPFLLQTNTGSWANITTANVIHVSTSGVVSTGSAAQGLTSGTLYWKIPASVSGTFRYICQNHPSMVGTITVKDIATI